MPPLPEKIEKKYFKITKSLTNISKKSLFALFIERDDNN